LDPGHSGKDISGVDKTTGLIDHDYPNHPEMEECFRVAKMVQEQLEKDGYKVVRTKATVSDSVSLRRRADIAQQAEAAIGISIHNDHGKRWSDFAQVYAQALGQWRGGTEPKPKVIFKNSQVAATSLSWASQFAVERSRAEGHKVTTTFVSFNGRKGIEPGN